MPASAPASVNVDTTLASTIHVDVKRSGSTAETITVHDFQVDSLTYDARATNASGTTCVLRHKVCGASEPTSYSFSDGSGAICSIHIIEYSGVDTTTPLDVAASTNTQNATAAPVATGVSDVTAGSMLVGGITADNTANATAGSSGVTNIVGTSSSGVVQSLTTFER
jgi:hypothetical protein